MMTKTDSIKTEIQLPPQTTMQNQVNEVIIHSASSQTITNAPSSHHVAISSDNVMTMTRSSGLALPLNSPTRKTDIPSSVSYDIVHHPNRSSMDSNANSEIGSMEIENNITAEGIQNNNVTQPHFIKEQTKESEEDRSDDDLYHPDGDNTHGITTMGNRVLTPKGSK